MPAHDDPAAAAEAAFDWPEAIRLYEEALSSLPREHAARSAEVFERSGAKLYLARMT